MARRSCRPLVGGLSSRVTPGTSGSGPPRPSGAGWPEPGVARDHGRWEGRRMPIPIEAYTEGGVVRGMLARFAHVREALDGQHPVEIEDATFASPGSGPQPAGALALEPDDVLLVVEPAEDVGPV